MSAAAGIVSITGTGCGFELLAWAKAAVAVAARRRAKRGATDHGEEPSCIGQGRCPSDSDDTQVQPPPIELIVKASTPRLNTNAARQCPVTTRRTRRLVMSTSLVWNVMPSVKLK